MKSIFLRAMLLGWGLLSPLASAQSAPATFPLAGDWEGVLAVEGAVHHLVLHMSTTPEGRMTALLDDIDQNFFGDPATGGSFDGSHLILRFFYWKNNGTDILEERFAPYEATVNASNSEMTGVWTQEGSWPLNFKRMTWQAKVPKSAPPTIFDGDWVGIEYERPGHTIHFIFHIHNTEDGLMVLVDCPEEKFKGALAKKVIYDLVSRQFSINFGPTIFTGKMTADGKAFDTSMTEPGFHFLIHFDRLAPKMTEPN
jgi:hypothetical protein